MPLSGAIAEHFHSQAAACRRLGSPFTAHLSERLVALLGDDTGLWRCVQGWAGDPRDDALALRLCGGLHALARGGDAPRLTAAYPPAPLAAPGFDEAVAAAIRTHDGWLTALIAGPPQTNEVARSGILLGGLLTIAARTGLPIELFEIGGSAGLNLLLDRYAYRLGEGRAWGDPSSPVNLSCEWRGATPPLDVPLTIVTRRCSDQAPIDAADPAARLRLLAHIWPDQPERLSRIEAALALAVRKGVRVERADAAEWVEALLRRPAPRGRTRVLMHSIMWQYMPAATRRFIAAAMERAGAKATEATPLAWLRLEPDSLAGVPAILLDLWPRTRFRGQDRLLGRGDWHGRWAEWASL